MILYLPTLFTNLEEPTKDKPYSFVSVFCILVSNSISGEFKVHI